MMTFAYNSTCSTIYVEPTCNPIGRTPYVPQCIVTASHIPPSKIGYNQREARRIDERPGREFRMIAKTVGTHWSGER
jgi:hypothetical protein